MKKGFYISIWELSKLFTDWRKSIVVFILPPMLMFCALILFPTLVNYLDTGSIKNSKILIVDAPADFVDYYDSNFQNFPFNISYLKSSEVTHSDIEKPKYKNTIFVWFEGDNNITIEYLETNSLYNKAGQFITDVLEPYNNHKSEIIIFNVDSFNPVRKILDNRFVANIKGASIIPQIIIILMYYTVYSLSQDSFYGDNKRGFLTKLRMAPVSIKSIIYGKMSAVVITSLATALVTFVILFLASWVNTSNDSMSLIPFGLWLMPNEFLLLLLVMLIASINMEFLAVLIIFSLEKQEDVTLNLQLPLVLILIEVFLLMIRANNPVAIEYWIPIHNNMVIMRDILHANVTILNFIAYFISSAITIFICDRSLWTKRILNGK